MNGGCLRGFNTYPGLVRTASVALALGAAACSGDDGGGKVTRNDTEVRSTAYENTTTMPEAAVGDPEWAVPIVCDWSIENPQPLVNDDPVVVQVDGRCDTEPNAPMAIYDMPSHDGLTIDEVNNGDLLEVICADPTGDEARDVQDTPAHTSKVWLKVKTPQSKIGYISQVWTGFPFINNGHITTCPEE